MDPLHKIDSAISVASRDQLFHDKKLNTTPTPTQAAATATAPTIAPTITTPVKPSSVIDHHYPPRTSSQSSIPPPPPRRQQQQQQQQQQQPHEAQPHRNSSSATSHNDTTQPPPPVTQRPTMENLVAPLDVAQRHPPPPFVDRPDPSWYETQLRPPTPPKYAVDPAIENHKDTTSSSSSSNNNNSNNNKSTTSSAADSATTTASTTTTAASASASDDATTTNTDYAGSASQTNNTSVNPSPSPLPPTTDDNSIEDGDREREETSLTFAHHYPDALTQAGTGAIIVDQEQLDFESDQGYESDRASFASTSLSSSVRDYLFENGRRYHRFREGRYNFPNDEPEQDREDMKHQCVKMLCQGQLFFAPIEEGPLQNILDIGTGTGIWAIEMGDQFPSANVLGIDLSPIQPEWVPANVHFVVDDAESDWIYPDNHFDYIHTRHTVMGIKDWPKLYRTAQQYMRPGAWIESQEIWHYPISANNSMPPDHPIAQYWGLINEGLQRLGVDFHACAGGKIAKMMRDAGYQNVHERIFHVPIGTWAKHPNLKMVGEYWRHVLLEGIQAIALGPLTRGCGWTRDQVEVFLVEVRREYYNNSCLMYMPMYVTCGQKPEH